MTVRQRLPVHPAIGDRLRVPGTGVIVEVVGLEFSLELIPEFRVRIPAQYVADYNDRARYCPFAGGDLEYVDNVGGLD